jgi:hypothetical protein
MQFISYVAVVIVVLCIRLVAPAETLQYLRQSGLHNRHAATGGESLEIGAVVMLVSNWTSTRLGRNCNFNDSMDALSSKWRPHHSYPVILMNTMQWARHDMAAIRRRWNNMDIKFINIAKWFESALTISRFEFEDHRKPLSSIAYKRMCYFFFRGFTEVPLLMRYRYLLRLDDDTCLLDHVNFDMFRHLAHYRAAYGYSHTWYDGHRVTRGLYKFVADYVAKNNITLANEPLYKAVTTASDFPSFVPCYNTNFEVINTVRYRDPAVMQFVDAVSESNMIFHRRWGDAPLRLAMAMLFWRKEEIIRFSDFEIQHSNWPPFAMTEHPNTSDPLLWSG